MAHYKTIVHIDELSKWTLALGNVRNLLKAEGDTFTVEVLANSEAVKRYIRTEAGDPELKDLLDQGVRFVACNNALKANKLLPEDLLEGVEVVPAGVVELIKKQAEGYAYLKP